MRCCPRFFLGPLVLLWAVLADAHDAGWNRAVYRPHPLPPGVRYSRSQNHAQLIMADVINRLGVRLLAVQNQYNENNIAISPYGALSVLIALGEGLQGDAVREIQLALQLPNDISIIRQGLRDINRHLQSYFIPREGFLAGLTLNYDSVTLKPLYQDILLYYGYDLTAFNVALYPPPPKMHPPESTTTSTTNIPPTDIKTTPKAIETTTIDRSTKNIVTPKTSSTTIPTITMSPSNATTTNPDTISTTILITSDTTSTATTAEAVEAGTAIPTTTQTVTGPTTISTMTSFGEPIITLTSTISSLVTTVTSNPKTNTHASNITRAPKSTTNISLTHNTNILSPYLAPFELTIKNLSDLPTGANLTKVPTGSTSSSSEPSTTDSSLSARNPTTALPGLSSIVSDSTTTNTADVETTPIPSADSTIELLSNVPTTEGLLGTTTDSGTEKITESQRESTTELPKVDMTTSITETTTLQTIVKTEEVTEQQILTTEAITAGTTEQQILTTEAITAGTTQQQILTTQAITADTTKQQILTTEAVTAGTTEQQILTTQAITADTTKQEILTTEAVTAGITEQQILTTEAIKADTTKQQILTTEAVTAGTTEQQTQTTEAVTAGTTKQQILTTEAITADTTKQQIVTTEAVTAAITEQEILTTETVIAGTTKQQILTTEAITADITKQQILTTEAVTAAITGQEILTTEAATAGSTEQQIPTTEAITVDTTKQQILTTEAATAGTTEQQILTTEAINTDTTKQQILTTETMTAGTMGQQILTTEAMAVSTTEQQISTTEAITAAEAEETTMTTTEFATTSAGFAGSPKQKRMSKHSSISLNKLTLFDNYNNPRRRVAKSVSDYIDYQKHFADTMYSYPKPIDPPIVQEPLYFLTQGYYKDYNVNFMRYNTLLPVCDVVHLDARALKFPLDRKEYYLLILLPNKPNGVDKLVRDLGYMGDFRHIVDCLRTIHVDVTIPSFKMNGYVKLTNVFQRMGIKKVFEPNQADFTPMTDQNQIYVTNIEQAITVDIKHYVDIENMSQKSSYPWEFKADHPFLFFVLDSELQVALMSGKITNPLNTRIS